MGVHPRGAPGGEPRCGQGGQQQEGGAGRERARGRAAPPRTGGRATRPRRKGRRSRPRPTPASPSPSPSRRTSRTMSAGSRPDREADAHLGHALEHGVRHRSVDPDRGQEQGRRPRRRPAGGAGSAGAPASPPGPAPRAGYAPGASSRSIAASTCRADRGASACGGPIVRTIRVMPAVRDLLVRPIQRCGAGPGRTPSGGRRRPRRSPRPRGSPSHDILMRLPIGVLGRARTPGPPSDSRSPRWDGPPVSRSEKSRPASSGNAHRGQQPGSDDADVAPWLFAARGHRAGPST